jgi:hypothetical protein
MATIPPPFEIVVPEDFEFTDRSLQTASWYDTHLIKAGTYLGQSSSINGDTYARLATTVLVKYRENRLLQHVIPETREPNTNGIYTVQMYGYEVKDGKELFSGKAHIRVLTESDSTAG